MEKLNKAKQEFEKKLGEVANKEYPALTPNAKMYVIYEKLMELQAEMEKLKEQFGSVKEVKSTVR